MTQSDEFITEMIVNVVMLTRLDENVSKIQFLDINVSNFLSDKNVIIFYWRKMSIIVFFLPKCQYISLDQNINKLLLSSENVCNFLLNSNMSMFLLD